MFILLIINLIIGFFKYYTSLSKFYSFVYYLKRSRSFIIADLQPVSPKLDSSRYIR